jgi:hypothetical protein
VERITASIGRYPAPSDGHASSLLVSTGASALTKDSSPAERERGLGRLAEVVPTLGRMQIAML